MEYKRQLSGRWFQKMVIFLVFGLFTATAQAQIGLLPPPDITVQPVGTNVQNGDSATFNASATCSILGVIDSVTWLYNGKSVPTTNTTVTIGGGGLLSSKISTTLTVNRATSGSAGNYSVEIVSLLCGTTTSSSAALVVLTNPPVPIVVSAMPSASGMLTNGFKVQFSAPAGSNVVIQASSNLNSWTSICTNVAVGGSVTYTDAVAKTSSCRFYRGVLK